MIGAVDLHPQPDATLWFSMSTWLPQMIPHCSMGELHLLQWSKGCNASDASLRKRYDLAFA